MQFIIKQNELLELIDENIKIIDVRDEEEYEKEHLVNSINIPEIFTYLPVGITSEKEKESFNNYFQNLLSNHGIDNDDKIIFYEEKYTLKSPRGITILKYLGHDENKLFVLEGGFDYWKENKLSLTKEIPQTNRSNYKINILDNFFLDYNEMIEAIYDTNKIKLDVRDKDEWLGISSSPYGLNFAPKKGRIPNSIWIEWYKFISDDLLKVESLDFIKNELNLQNIKTDDEIILYCFKGARVSNTYIALRALGYKNIKFYFAGWNEWCRISSAPIINEAEENDNPIMQENITLKNRLEEISLKNSKMILFPKYNDEPIFAFNREGEVFHDNLAKKTLLSNIKTLKDLLPQEGEDFIHNFIDNNQTQKIIIKENDFYYQVKLKGSRDVNAILAYVHDITKLKKLNENLEEIVEERTEKLLKKTQYIEENIQYASLIQESILPSDSIFENSFSDYFIFWKPCDGVGGDIYFANSFGVDNEETIIVLLDGAGHSISGALLTMLLKAIESKIISSILRGELEPRPDLILERLNHDFKVITSQNKNSNGVMGFDGAVLYYNKKKKQCLYSGAKTPLYVVKNNNLEIIKGDRVSLGYKRNKIDQKFKLFELEIENETTIYLATDGLFDQELHDNTFFGKSRFKEFITANKASNLSKQKKDLIKEFEKLKQDKKQTDDISIIAVKF